MRQSASLLQTLSKRAKALARVSGGYDGAASDNASALGQLCCRRVSATEPCVQAGRTLPGFLTTIRSPAAARFGASTAQRWQGIGGRVLLQSLIESGVPPRHSPSAALHRLAGLAISQLDETRPERSRAEMSLSLPTSGIPDTAVCF